MIVAAPNLLDSPSTLIVGSTAFQHHVTLDLCFHTIQHGAQLCVAADERGDISAFQNEYARWRQSHKLDNARDDSDVVGFAGTHLFTSHTEITDAVERTLTGHKSERPIIVVREFNGFGSITESVNRWHKQAALLLKKGKPLTFVSVASIGGEPFNAADYAGVEIILRVSYGFRLPPGALRAHENTELTLDYIKPQRRSLYVKGAGHPDIVFQYGTELADFTQPIPA